MYIPQANQYYAGINPNTTIIISFLTANFSVLCLAYVIGQEAKLSLE